MRILYATNQLDMGGIEINLVRLTRGFVEGGHDVAVASRGGRLLPAFEAAGGRHVSLLLGLRRPRSVIQDLRALRAAVADFSPDVIHVMSASTAPLVAIATRSLPKRNRPRIVSSLMGLQIRPDEGRARILLRAYLTTLGASVVISISPVIARTLASLPIRPSRVESRPVVGVEEPRNHLPTSDVRSAVRDELGLPGEAGLVTTVGRLDASKSHHLFVEAAAHARASGCAATWLLVGGGGLAEELEDGIRRSNLGGKVRLLGERDDAERIIAASDVYVRPGVVEGFVGITVLEAQARSIPVVSFETEDVKLAVEHGCSGLLVRSGDARALASAVVALLNDGDMRSTLGQAGYESWRAKFEMRAVTAGLLDLYQRVAGTKGERP